MLGFSRVAFAMGRETDLPQGLAKLGKGQNPWRSVLFGGIIAILIAAFAPLTKAISISSFGILLIGIIFRFFRLGMMTPKKQ